MDNGLVEYRSGLCCWGRVRSSLFAIAEGSDSLPPKPHVSPEPPLQTVRAVSHQRKKLVAAKVSPAVLEAAKVAAEAHVWLQVVAHWLRVCKIAETWTQSRHHYQDLILIGLVVDQTTRSRGQMVQESWVAARWKLSGTSPCLALDKAPFQGLHLFRDRIRAAVLLHVHTLLPERRAEFLKGKARAQQEVEPGAPGKKLSEKPHREDSHEKAKSTQEPRGVLAAQTAGAQWPDVQMIIPSVLVGSNLSFLCVTVIAGGEYNNDNPPTPLSVATFSQSFGSW